ncbi:MAG TPA: POTRA domain-containing protein, partial [Myxococcaceae bacterium]|nr:POTRA domain-containing protein [Myxococcaceae bacterium]
MLLLAAGAVRAQGALPSPEAPRVAAVQLEMRGGGAVPTDLSARLAVQPGEPLSVRAVRRSIVRLFSTGRFADVVALGREGPDGLVVVFQLAPSVRIARVEVTGAGALGKDEVLAAARLAPGSEFWPERLVDARTGLLAAYARRGWNAAQVTATSQPAKGDEVVVQLEIQPGPPTRVTALRFDGQPGLPTRRLAAAFGLRVGDILDRTRLDPGAEALRTLYRDTHHARARVGSPRVSIEGTAAVVSVPVEAGPRFTFRFEGNRRYPSAWLGGALEIDPAETLDRSVLEREARRVEAFYRYRGFRDVRVEPREVQSPDGTRAVVVFHVSEGRQVLVRSVQFEGRAGLPEEDLRTILERIIRDRIPEPGEQRLEWDPLQPESQLVTAGRPDTPTPPASAVFVEEAWRDAAEAMQRAYRELGWVDAKVTLAGAVEEVGASVVDVRFRLEEGVRTFVRSVRFQGLPPGLPPPAVPSLRPGMPFSQTRLEEALTTTLRDLGRASYLFAQVSGKADISTDRTAADPILIVDPGPAVRVGQVVLRGLARTDESLVRANLKLVPGQPLDPEALFESQRELLLLGLFRTVSVRLISPDTPEPVKDVVVEARERPRLSGSVGFGYSLEDGPRIIGDLVYPNVFGEGINFTFRGKVNYVGWSALPLQDYVNGSELQGLNGLDFNLNAGLSQPRIWQFLPAKVGARLTFTAERVHRPTYFYGRVAGLFGVDWAITRWLRLTGSYLIENVLVRAQAGVEQLLAPTRQTDAERLRFPTGNFFLQTVGT